MLDDNIAVAIEGLMTGFEDFKARSDRKFQTLESAFGKIEAKAGRPGAGGSGFESAGSPEVKAAFEKFVRFGEKNLSGHESKMLMVSDDTAGGYLAPEQFITELLRNVVLFSGVRQIARVAQMGSALVNLPRRTGTLTGSWVGETLARSEAQPAYGLNSYPAREMACYVDVSNAMLDDAAFDISAELSFDLGEEFGRLEGAAFVNGTSPDASRIYAGNADQLHANGRLGCDHGGQFDRCFHGSTAAVSSQRDMGHERLDARNDP